MSALRAVGRVLVDDLDPGVVEEAMKMHVHPQRGVGALDEGDRTKQHVLDRAQAEL